MMYNYNDGGRSKYYKGTAGDCGARSAAIALELDYKECYKSLALANKLDGYSKSARNGIRTECIGRWLNGRGWNRVSVPLINGRRARVHNLPPGRFITRMSSHYAAVIDGAVEDTWDCRHRAVYSYWTKAT